MSNPISKGIERKKEKEESEIMKELKAKTAYKKQKEDIFETIESIQKERQDSIKREKIKIEELQERLGEIGLFAISLYSVNYFNSYTIENRSEEIYSFELLKEAIEHYLKGTFKQFILERKVVRIMKKEKRPLTSKEIFEILQKEEEVEGE